MNEEERNEMWKAMMPVTRKALSERAIEITWNTFTDGPKLKKYKGDEE